MTSGYLDRSELAELLAPLLERVDTRPEDVIALRVSRYGVEVDRRVAEDDDRDRFVFFALTDKADRLP